LESDRKKRKHPGSRVGRSIGLIPLVLAALFPACVARRPARPPMNMTAAEPGETEFQTYCAACHQHDGQGMSDTPPLAGSAWITGPAQRLTKIVLHGVRGRMEVAGRIYDREMPGFAPVLSDAAAAALVSFVRKRFGRVNEQVTTESVTRVRAAHQSRTDYWSVQELLDEP
jgi:mono/diheme cytochrome c family protein